MAKDTGKDVAVKPEAENLPAFMQRNGPTRGSENVKAEDLVIPRIDLVQALSPCVDETNGAAYIEGARPGMLFNNVTRELYGTSVKFIPVMFRKEYIVWKKRALGGGFVGAFSTEQYAEEQRMAQDKPDDHQVNETMNFFGLFENPVSGRMEEIVVSMAITKLKTGRKLNSLIRMNGGDSFTRYYTLSSCVEKNTLGQPYHNYAIASGSYVTQAQFDRAEILYEAVKAGTAVANRDAEETGTPSDDGAGEF